MSDTSYHLVRIARCEHNPSADENVIFRVPTLEILEDETQIFIIEAIEWLEELSEKYSHYPSIELPVLYSTKVMFHDLNARVNVVIFEEGDDSTLREARKQAVRQSVELMLKFS